VKKVKNCREKAPLEKALILNQKNIRKQKKERSLVNWLLKKMQ
jgi:hypothetical protein